MDFTNPTPDSDYEFMTSWSGVCLGTYATGALCYYETNDSQLNFDTTDRDSLYDMTVTPPYTATGITTNQELKLDSLLPSQF